MVRSLPLLDTYSKAGRWVTRGLLVSLSAATLGCAWFSQDRSAIPQLLAAIGVSCVLLLILYQRQGFTKRQVLGLALLFRLFFFPVLPGLSDDAYRYVWDGWLQVDGINPYRFAPEHEALAAYQEGELFELLNSAGFYSVYPPASQVVFVLGALVRGMGWEASYYVIKLVFVLAELSGVWILTRMVSAHNAILYAWNPVVLIELIGQAHTEALMVSGLIWTVWGVRESRRAPLVIGAAMSVAVWSKLYPVLLGPLLLRRIKKLPLLQWSTVFTVLFCVWYAASYVLPNVQESLQLYVAYFEFNAGPYFAVKEWLRWSTGEDWSKIIGPRFQRVFLLSLPLWYVWDWRANWSLPRAFIVVQGAYVLTATTVHPWYLTGILAMIPFLRSPSWHWLWVSVLSMGTYLLYVGDGYWAFVILAWGGGAVLALARYRNRLLQPLQRLRARLKAAHVRRLTGRHGGARILDLGAAEGYLGLYLSQDEKNEVVLTDVLPMNRTHLPHVVYDGYRLPFPDDTFDVVILYFVLHHTHDAAEVLCEARRVSRDQVFIAESVYTSDRELRWLTRADRLVNRLRSNGAMQGQEEHLHFRTRAKWEALLTGLGLHIEAIEQHGIWIHRPLFIVASKTAIASNA